MTKLDEKALLVTLAVSQWTARKKDKAATADIIAQAGAVHSAGAFNKALLPDNVALKTIHQKTTSIRTKFYKNTLCWGLQGVQLLPSKNYMNFSTEFRQDKADWEKLVAVFCDDYENKMQTAQQQLGGLHNPDDYPSVHEVRNKFRMKMHVTPVPSNDFRVQAVDDAEIERIRQDMKAEADAFMAEAMQDLWQRLYTPVKLATEKLVDPRSIFNDSLVGNLREICELLPRLNVTDDPDLEAMRQLVEGKLAHYHPDNWRNDPDLRKDVAVDAKDIMDKMGAFMNGLT